MSAIITKYWRTITFDFSGKEGSITGVFGVKVDSTGVPITEKGSCIWEEVSGAKIGRCTYDEYNDVLNIESEYNIFLSDFSVASENTTYTESDPTGTWSYVNANVEGFTITATAGAGGTISPTGSVTIEEGNDQTFSFISSTGYAISSVLVDGVSAGKVSYYTFTNVQADHTISVAFEAVPVYTITSSASAGGSISPSGETTVYEGDYKGFEITPSTGCATSSVLVDGVESISQLVGNEYTFTNVNADHTISASFTGEVITKTYREITFNFTGKGTYSGVFQIAVDSNGIPDVEDFENISGDGVEDVNYGINDVLNFNSSAGAGYLSNFSTAQPNQTYTESGVLNGTWSYTLGSTTTTYTIIPSASTGGSISPNTPQIVEAGDDETFTITPSNGYKITSVLVDGVDAGKVTTYTFTNVNAVHTISAEFEALQNFDIEVEMDLIGEDFKVEWQKFIDKITGSYALNIVSSTYDVTTGTGTITITETDTLPDNVFQSQTHITSVVLPECFEVIDDGAFAGCTSLRTISFPSSVTNFGTLVFDGCTSLGKIIMNAPNPPTIDGNDLGVDNVEVDVPEGAGQAYANALGWSEQEIVDPTPTATYGFNLDKMVDRDYIMQGIMKK